MNQELINSHYLTLQFPIGAKVRRKDSGAEGTIAGWFENKGFFYVRYFVEWDSDHLNKDGEKANSQWDFSQPNNLRVLGD